MCLQCTDVHKNQIHSGMSEWRLHFTAKTNVFKKSQPESFPNLQIKIKSIIKNTRNPIYIMFRTRLIYNYHKKILPQFHYQQGLNYLNQLLLIHM